MVVKIFNFSKCLKFTWKVNSQDTSSKPSNLQTLDNKFNPLLQRRYMVAFLGFLCAVVMHSQRLNISIAMVAMVNKTSTATLRMTRNETTECPSNLYNSSNVVPSKGEFQWSPELQGYILSAGFLGYVLTQIAGGILAGMFGTKKILVPGLLVAAACNLLSPLAAWESPYILLALTLIRGMAQGLKQPALSVLMSKWFARSERGFLSAFIYCGYPVGAFITCISGGRLCDLEFLGGWPLVFYTFGLAGVLVAILFLVFYYDKPEQDPRISEAELKHIQNVQEVIALSARPPTPWLAIVSSLPFYALVLALFGQYWMAFYFVTVHPIYLGTVLHIPIRQNGTLSSGPHLVQAIAGWCTCYFSYWMSRKSKIRIEMVRKGVNSLSCITFCIGLVGVFLAKCHIPLNELFLYVATGSIGFSFAGALITSVDMSPTFCGPLMGLASTLGSFAGFFVPVTVGKLTNEGQNLSQWGKIFLISTAISIGCGLVFQIFGSAEIQPWDPVHEKSADGKRNSETQQPEPITEVSCRL